MLSAAHQVSPLPRLPAVWQGHQVVHCQVVVPWSKCRYSTSKDVLSKWRLLIWGWFSSHSNPAALTISAARWSLNMPGGGISKSSPTLKERVKNIKCGKTPAYKSKSESKQWNLKNSKPLFYGSGFAWHKPHRQASALSAECYLLNGYQLINLDSDMNFEQGYWYEGK